VIDGVGCCDNQRSAPMRFGRFMHPFGQWLPGALRWISCRLIGISGSGSDQDKMSRFPAPRPLLPFAFVYPTGAAASSAPALGAC